MSLSKKVTLFLMALVIGLVIGLLVAIRLDIYPTATAKKETGEIWQTVSTVGIEDAIINVAKTIGKATVSISTEHIERWSRRSLPFEGFPFGDDFFQRFFEEFFGEIPGREYRRTGLGSGVIIDEEGYILTNEHVISGADKITVTLPDGREFKAEVKGKDVRSDLAIIKITGKNLPVAKLGDSDDLRIGQWVVAIGNPFGFAIPNPEPTVTVGVVSALRRTLGRSLSRDRDYSDLIQTDAAINPGNSGGPLVNLKGEIIGINVAIISTTGGYQGIGFAIPINIAKRIVNKLIEGKKILYGWLGVTVQDLTEDLAEHFGLEEKKGALVVNILPDSPAEEAGIREDDVILKFEDKEISNIQDLIRNVSKVEVGKEAELLVFRDRKKITLKVVIGERPEDLERLTEVSKKTFRGITVEELTPELSRRYRIEEKEGVIIIDVEPDSPSDEAGLIRGDLILKINHQKIRDLSDFSRITKDLKGNCLIRTRRGLFLVKE